MTQREALEAKFAPDVNPKLIELALLNHGLGDGTGEYTAETTMKDNLLAAEITVLSSLVGLKSESEGDVSRAYDYASRLASLKQSTEPTTSKPTIRAYSW